MSKLVIVVPAGRRAAGRGVLLGRGGAVRLAPFRVLATASQSEAAARGNPGRDWRRPFGDTPTGSYLVVGALPPSRAALPSLPSAERGPSEPLGALVLTPIGGNALEALRAGRARFLVHGGPVDASGRLRSTFGGVRVADDDLVALLRAINEANAEGDPLSSVEIEETSTPAWAEGPSDEVPSSRRPRRGGARPAAARAPVSRSKLAELGFEAKRGGTAPVATRRAFVGLALVTFGLTAFACGGSDQVGGSGAGGGGGQGGGTGHDGGGAGGGYDGGMPDAGHGGGGGGTTTGGTTTGTTSSGSTTTTSSGPTTDTTVTTGPTTDTTVTTGPTTDTTVTTGPTTDTTVTTGPTTDTTTVTTDTTTVTTDTTTVTTDTTTVTTDTTTFTTDTTGTTTDTTTTDIFIKRPPRATPRKSPPRDEGTGT